MISPENKPKLEVTAVRGVLWSGGGQAIKQILQIVTSITLARLLAPQDFGLMGMTMVFISVAQLFADFGIGAAIIQSQTKSRIVLSSSFWANLAIAATLALIIALCAPAIAAFYNNPELTPLIAVAALTMVLAGISVVPLSILGRDMRFADLTKSQVAGTLCGSTAAIALAWSGFGVWSLVAQPIVGSSVVLAMVMKQVGWLPSLEFSLSSITQHMRFGGGVLGANLITYVQRNTDSLLIGKYLGSGPLGYYQMAYQLMLFPLQQVSSVMVRVLFPTLSQLQHDLPRLRSAYLKAISAIALITFPMMMGLFAVAEDFIIVVLGEKWLPMLPVLQILAWVGMMQSVATTVGTIYLSVGAIRKAFLLSLGTTPLLVGALIAGLPWGIQGVAISYALISFSIFYLTLFLAFRLISLSMLDFHRAIWRPLICSIIMLVIVMLFNQYLPIIDNGTRLALLVSTGVISYIAISIAFNRHQLIELRRIIRNATKKPVS
ncbi:MAG: MOP flippase family protein [Pseudomonadota bacterium]